MGRMSGFGPALGTKAQDWTHPFSRHLLCELHPAVLETLSSTGSSNGPLSSLSSPAGEFTVKPRFHPDWLRGVSVLLKGPVWRWRGAVPSLISFWKVSFRWSYTAVVLVCILYLSNRSSEVLHAGPWGATGCVPALWALILTWMLIPGGTLVPLRWAEGALVCTLELCCFCLLIYWMSLTYSKHSLFVTAWMWLNDKLFVTTSTYCMFVCSISLFIWHILHICCWNTNPILNKWLHSSKC